MTQAPTDPQTDPETQPQAFSVLDFWLGDGLHAGWPTDDLNARWFRGGAALDQHIGQRFGQSVASALQGGLAHWEAKPTELLALVILLDQFTRNIYRGTAQAFAGDARAQRLSLTALANKHDQLLPWVGRLFLYMPLMHAESPALQTECVSRFENLLAQAPEPLKEQIAGHLPFARQHQSIIERFGRFPHRNAALGRSSTPEEDLFLKDGPRFGQ
jgi:uncharacterized protein (DUF924 family)